MKKKQKKTKYDYLKSSRYIVYDLSINDLQTRIERAKVYPTAESTAYFLGCTVGKLLNNSEPRKRIKGVDKKLYAVRTNTQIIPANLTNINNNSFKHKRVNNPNFIKS